MILNLQIISQSTVLVNVDSTQLTTQTNRTATLTLQAGSNIILNAAFTMQNHGCCAEGACLLINIQKINKHLDWV
ncbi:hypothetical protein CBP27_19735 [Fischerella thermalis WC542]|nr:hypothetical protein CBP10_18115 [Fischerella thermalis WC558]PLZ32220.1 hypothetical protein CBP27_19735 [Fischerella thermalis WC542]